MSVPIKQNDQNQGELIFGQLLEALNHNAEAVIELFHPEVIIEFPYASSLGTPSKMNFEEWYNYLKGGLPSMPNIIYGKFQVYKVNENSFWSEVYGETTIPSTKQLYKQNWVMHYTLKEGKINFYKEYWDPYAVIKAFGNGDIEAVKAVFNTTKSAPNS